jgi:hypothetical protein
LVGKTKFEALVKEIGEDENEDKEDEEDQHQDYLTKQLMVKNANHRPTEDKKLLLSQNDINKTQIDNELKKSLHRHSINSEHEEFLHPNMRESLVEKRVGDVEKKKKKKFNTCKSCFRRFDELIMKPILIHNYDKVIQGKKDEFMELFLVEGEEWEETYAKSGEEGV